MTHSFWIILLTTILYGVVHSLLASWWTKEQAQRWFGTAIKRWFRLLYNFLAVLLLLPVIILPVILIDKQIYIIPMPWILLSLAGQALAVVIMFLGLKQTGISVFAGIRQLFAPEDVDPPKLVTDGLYQYLRHPAYSAAVVFIWLIPIMTWNLLALNLGLTAYLVIGAHFEERKLRQIFGEAYRSYQQKTPMLVPFFPRIFDRAAKSS